jgi:hypothetical protein
MAQAVSPDERDKRIGTLRRFRDMLQAQRDRFQEYLAVLDKEQEVIRRGDTEALLAYVEREEHILKDIFNIQKVIDPLERLYRELAASGDRAEARADDEAAGLKATVERLGRAAAANAERNRGLLADRMAEVRSELKSLRGNPYAARPSIYADAGGPTMIDLEG